MLRQWDVGVSTNLNVFLCPFCKLEPDSHNHECNFCAQVWSMARSKAAMDGIGPNWEDIVNWIMLMSSKQSAISIIARLVLGATALSELCTILPVTKMIEQGRNLLNTRVQTDGQSDETSDSLLGQKDASIDTLMKINAPSRGTSSSAPGLIKELRLLRKKDVALLLKQTRGIQATSDDEVIRSIEIDEKKVTLTCLDLLHSPVPLCSTVVTGNHLSAAIPNTGKQEKERRTCVDYLKYEEYRVRIKYGSISKKKKSNYSSFQALRSSCNKDMVKYEDPQPSTTRIRALNERFNKKISPARTQLPGWSVCRPALGAHVFHFTLEETWIIKKDLDPLNRLWTPL
ncbi:hypothetical protein Tco_0749287 [Tanacetum coccineum]|uniref:Uncharacterized protein n=1 Tax=Tanacetum coccineum TaxID=301880 RepID=A0ABQ4YZ02_9ASTR